MGSLRPNGAKSSGQSCLVVLPKVCLIPINSFGQVWVLDPLFLPDRQRDNEKG